MPRDRLVLLYLGRPKGVRKGWAQRPTANVDPNQQRPLLGRWPPVSNGHNPRRRGQRVLLKMNRNCCWAFYPFLPYPFRSCADVCPPWRRASDPDR
eukprot:4575835-Pyramimonas_sp.AAC.1